MESTGGRGPVVWTAWALPVAAAAGAALTVRSDWWTVPTAAAAFLAGRRPGGTRAGALALSGAVAAGVLAVLLMPSLLVHATVFVGALVAGAMLPWFAGAPVTVRLVHGEGGTEVRVVNGPPARDRPGAAPSGGGRGLVGLDERVRLAGGTFRHGPYDGGFAVTATLPHGRWKHRGKPGHC
ncbi:MULTISPECIES: ATP-binding protein [Streptomyces]|uniref:Competence protein ComEC n=1 Tax=Streptomyces fradiae ATCC 10745 = DSM 40063 TaxID=1319510 RepID=A0ABQ6Y0D9_STRFR|nr:MULTISPECIES: ATP-binding protein [Streptomyces]KAF0651372.1 hypothetical protein K701_02400 [Streptomyces fradiae ATCC 10745 = DSM 40063]QEV14048.1 ATP-binding protein [Streptomyces fradiae ATCC 10745 = DSM 40063]UQS30719.1 ATP-binding protein [Streptomyces fradiae]